MTSKHKQGAKKLFKEITTTTKIAQGSNIVPIGFSISKQN